MTDPLDLLPRTGKFAAELLVARLKARGEMDVAELLRAQASWLRTGSAERLAEAIQLTRPILDPSTGQWRITRVHFAGAFGENVSFLGDEAWAYDDDLVSLIDGGLQDSRRHPTPWDANESTPEMLREAVEHGRYPKAVRLMLFEGSERLFVTLRALGLATAVTHLELRLQRESDETRLGERFPGLRGLALGGAKLRQALRAPLSELRALVVRGPVDPTAIAWALRQAPNLAHLCVSHARWNEALLREILASASGLKTLQLYDVNQARQFPFGELASLRSQWAHLSLLGVPGHLVADGEHAHFADDPQVVFVGHDRREVAALDFETHGWADGTR